MPVSGVGPGTPSGPLPPVAPPAGSDGLPAAGAGAETPAGGDSATISAAGQGSLIGADGKVRTGWGLVDAPPVVPTDPGKLIEMKKYGDMEVPNPRPDIEGPAPKPAEIINKPVEGSPTPIRKNKFSIVTGPPQGDP
jgi:hypothetical protein